MNYIDECGACGNKGLNYSTYRNQTKNIETKLCPICEKTARLNGYKIEEK